MTMRNMARWKRFIWTLTGILAGIAAAVSLRHVFSPVRYFPEHHIWAFVSPGCPSSMDFFIQVAREPKFWSAILLVPADDSKAAMPRSLVMCRTTLKQIDWYRHLPSKVVPDSLACRWLVEDSSKIYKTVSVQWPSWYHHGRILSDSEFGAVLDEEGLAFDATTRTVLFRGQEVPSHRRQNTDSPDGVATDSVWQDLSEPHIVGW